MANAGVSGISEVISSKLGNKNYSLPEGAPETRDIAGENQRPSPPGLKYSHNVQCGERIQFILCKLYFHRVKAVKPAIFA